MFFHTFQWFCSHLAYRQLERQTVNQVEGKRLAKGNTGIQRWPSILG